MLSCSICISCFGTVLLLFRHLKLIHGMYPRKSLRLKCGQTGCCLQFPSYSGFRRHLIKIHGFTENIHVPPSQWKKYFKNKWGILHPVELQLGVRYYTRRNNTIGTYEQVSVNDKFMYAF